MGSGEFRIGCFDFSWDGCEDVVGGRYHRTGEERDVGMYTAFRAGGKMVWMVEKGQKGREMASLEIRDQDTKVVVL